MGKSAGSIRHWHPLFKGGGGHALSSLLELPAGADVAVNLCHAGSMCLWNSSRNGEVFRK